MAGSYRDLVLRFIADTAPLKATATDVRKATSKAAGEAETQGTRAGKGFGSHFKSGVQKIAAGLGGLFIMDKIKDFSKAAYGEAREAQKVGAQTTAVIKSTGGAARITAKQIGDLATAISNKTGIDDESIQTGENMLLTFKNLRNEAGRGNDIFNQTTQIMTDMSVATGKDMTGSAVMLGKALNDPAKGISALTRVGVTFTEQQKKQIKSLQAHGKTLDAQKIILRELSSEFGGSAAAQATAGEKLATTWKNFQEQVGTAFLPVIDQVLNVLSQHLLPALSSLFGLMVKHKTTVMVIVATITALVVALKTASIVTGIYETVTTLAGIATAVFATEQEGLTKATKIATIAQWAMNAAMDAMPILLIVAGIAALVAGLIYAYKHFKWFRKFVDGMWTGIKAGAKAFAKFFTTTIPAAFRKVVGWIKANWKKAVFLNPVTAAIALLIKHRKQIQAIFNALVRWIKTTFTKGWAAVKTAFTKPVQAALNSIRNLFGKIRTAFTTTKNWVKDTWRKAWSGVKDWVSKAVRDGRDKTGDALAGVRKRFTDAKNWVRDTWRLGWKKAKDWITNPVKDAKDAIARILGGKGLQKVFRGAVDAFGRIWGGLKSAIGKPINAVIRFINLGLIRGGINKILGALGVPKKQQIPWIAPVKFARGGPIRGRGTGTSDSILMRGSAGEHVLTAEEVRKFGGHGRILAWRKAVRAGKAYDYPGYAAGGVVRPVPGGFGPFPSYPGHTGVDFPVGMGTPVHAVMAGLIKTVRALTYSYGRHIIETLPIPGNYEALYAHLQSFAVHAGQRVGAGQIIGYSDSTGNSTGPHLHFTLQHPGGNYVDPTSFLNGGAAPAGGGIGGMISAALGFLGNLSPVQWLAKKAAGLRNTILDRIGTNPWAQGLARIPGVIISKAAGYLRDKLFGGAMGEPGGSGVERWRSTITAALRMNGLPTTADYVNAWLRQVASESGGNPRAVQHGYTDINTITGDLAKGLLQTISSTFNANAFPGHQNIFNGFDNALAAIRYAKNRYGVAGMLSVIGHGHGYDGGGWLPPGISMAVNRTGRPEPVLTGRQWDRLADRPAVVINVNGALDPDAVGRQIDQLLTRYGRLRGGVRLNRQVAA